MTYLDEFIKKYDMNDPNINYKYYHSYRVMECMELLSTKLELTAYEIELSKCIGLLHDIGRFEQDKLYNSFKDDKMDHGDYGANFLKENNVLKYFKIDKKDYEIIYKAIKNHNKFKIEDNLTEKELFFSKLIRDADKLDIFYAIGNPKIKNTLIQDKKEISKEIKDLFYQKLSIKNELVKNKNEQMVLTLALIYDINFLPTLKLIYENKYLDKIYERIENKEILKPYFNYINNYIKERIEQNVR